MDWLAYAWSLRLPFFFIHSYSSSPNYGLNPKMGHWQIWVKKDLAFHIDDIDLTSDYCAQEVHRREQEIVEKNQELVEMKRKNQMVIPSVDCNLLFCFVVLLNWDFVYSGARKNTIATNTILPIISGARHSAEPDQGAADEVGRAEDGAQVQRDQLRECHQLTHRQAGRGAVIFSKFGCKKWAVMDKGCVES